MQTPTIKELIKQVQTKNGLYSGFLAEKIFNSYTKFLTKRQLFALAKRLSLAKWSVPKVIKMLKNKPTTKIGERCMISAACGLCFDEK